MLQWLQITISKNKAYIFFLQLHIIICTSNCDNYAYKLYNQENGIAIDLERSESQVVIFMLIVN